MLENSTELFYRESKLRPPDLSGLESVSTQQENSASLYPCDSSWFCTGHFLL